MIGLLPLFLIVSSIHLHVYKLDSCVQYVIAILHIGWSVLLLSRAGHMVKSEDLHGDKTLYELRRQYHCMAYNMLMAVITCTQSKMQFYTGFLFKEDLTKVVSFALKAVSCHLLN